MKKRYIYLSILALAIAGNVQADLGPWNCGSDALSSWANPFTSGVMATVEIVDGDTTLRIYAGDPGKAHYMAYFGALLDDVTQEPTGRTDAPWDDIAENISTVVIEEGVQSIGMRAFYSIKNIKQIYIPGSIEEVGPDIFHYDFNKSFSIYCNGDTAIRVRSGGQYSPNYPRPYHQSATLYVKNASALASFSDANKTDTKWWSNFENKVVTGINIPRSCVTQTIDDQTKATLNVSLYGATDSEKKQISYKVVVTNIIDPTDERRFTVKYSASAKKWEIQKENPSSKIRRMPIQLRDTVRGTTESLQIDITNLQANATYGYSITATDALDMVVGRQEGAFLTSKRVATDIEETASDLRQFSTQKVFRNGQLFIIRDDKVYIVTGAEVK